VAATPVGPNLDEGAINIFTDGSSFSGPRRGGVGFVIITVDDDGHPVEHAEQPQGYRSGTNQQMELMACIEALVFVTGRYSPVDVRDYRKVVIWTDSTYVANNFTYAKFNWQSDGWLTRDGNPVLNAHLWKRLVAAASKVGRRVDIKWCKGHSAANPHNKTADKLARASARGVLQPPVSISRVLRKQSTKLTELGSIKPEGQRLMLRVIGEQRLPEHRTYYYKCEVVSKGNRYYGNVDNIFSESILNVGHVYSVRLNSDPKQPRIVKVYREIERRVRDAS
jgi:ribonuclease HI